MRSILPLGYFGMMHLNLDYFSLSFLHNNNQGQGTQSKTSGCHRVIIYECKRLRRMLFFFRRSLQTKQLTFGALLIGSVIGLSRTGNRHRSPTLKSCTWTTISECIKLDKAMSLFRSRKNMTLFRRNGRCVMS